VATNKLVMRIGKGGSIRAVHADGYDFQRVHGCGPARRASHVEPIQSGPYAGWWHVDMSPLGPEFNYCLWPPHPPTERAAALAAEVEHLLQNWILKDDGRLQHQQP
jgi:hypothetical protein